MSTFSENVRKLTTFFLAVFLWLHAIFFLNLQSTLISKSAQTLRLTTSEVVLLALLVIFSFTAGSSFWKAVKSLAYIYGFPLVLVGYALYGGFVILRAMQRWFKAQANLQPIGESSAISNETQVIPAPPDAPVSGIGSKERVAEVLRVLVRPFQRFTFLWCILLLVATHTLVVWLCLVVVLLHLARQVFRILQITFFSGPWLKKIGTSLVTTIETALAGIAVVTPDSSPTAELRNLWNQLNIWTKVTNFLKDPYLVSRWAWVLGVLFFGSIYAYVALLFSFAYYGIARVSGVSYSWPDALVTSLFIPFFVPDLPKVLALRLLGGIHCLLVVALGIGTLVSFIQRRVRSIHRAAMEISDRLADQNIREKFLILEAKLASAPTVTPAPPAPDKKE